MEGMVGHVRVGDAHRLFHMGTQDQVRGNQAGVASNTEAME